MNDKNNSPVITLSLVSLTMGGLSIGMTEFLMMGVLPDISHSLQVSIPQAGYLISIYALGVVIGAPLMAAIAGNHKPKQMLIALMLMVFVFNGMFAVAPGYGWLLAARFLAGLPHGAFFGIGAVVATKLAKPGREARSVALMFAGLTVANIIGVPLGTFISHNFSWRFSFGLVALFALMAIVSIRFWMPDVRMEKQGSFAASLGIFKKIDLWLVIAISAIGTGGFFSWISYIAPVVIHVSGFSSSLVALVMVIIGLGMAAGNFLGGRMADRFAPLKAIAILLLLMIVVLLGFLALIHFKLPTIFMAFVVGAVGFAVIAPMQILIIQVAQGAEMLASSTLQATSNFGNALGAFFGGVPIAAGYGYTSPEFVGCILAGFGFCICLLLFYRFNKATKTSSIASPVPV